MAEKGRDLMEEQRAYCKIRSKLGQNASEIKNDLDIVYGEGALKYRTVARWVALFRDGRESVKDGPRSGRPSSAVSEDDVISVKKHS